MALSNSTVIKLAEALKPEIVDYIYADERWVEFLMEVIPDGLDEKIGPLDDLLRIELAQCIMDKITLK